MRFTGRIRFQDIDTGDLDVSVEVDDTHVHLRSGDESLGSWCLADVVASRLVANEFEIDLGGETIVFEADDQVNFAYGAVQKMAEGWARYHSMNVLVRHRAIASARRKNETSRLDEARRVFTAARNDLFEHAEESEPEPVERDEAVAESPIGRLTRHRSGGATGWGPVDDGGGAGVDEEDDAEPDAVAADRSPTSDHIGSNGDRSGGEAGAAYERAGRPHSHLDRDHPLGPAAEADAVTESGERPESSKPDRPRHPDLPPPKGRLPRLDAFPRRETEEEPGPGPAGAGPDDADRPGSPHEDAGGGPGPPSPGGDAAPADPAPESDPQPVGEAADRELPTSPADPTGEDDRAVPEEVAEEMPTAAAPTPAGSGPSRVEPSPGAFADGHHPSETSGLRASLRSMFSKTEEHEHSFVTSTTAVGLTRHVCLECGHVSIGVDE